MVILKKLKILTVCNNCLCIYRCLTQKQIQYNTFITNPSFNHQMLMHSIVFHCPQLRRTVMIDNLGSVPAPFKKRKTEPGSCDISPPVTVPQSVVSGPGCVVQQSVVSAPGGVVPQSVVSTPGGVVPQSSRLLADGMVPESCLSVPGGEVQPSRLFIGGVVPQNSLTRPGGIAPQSHVMVLGNVVPKSHVLAPSGLIPQKSASKFVGLVPQSCMPVPGAVPTQSSMVPQSTLLVPDGVVSLSSRLADVTVPQTKNIAVEDNIACQMVVGSKVLANESGFEGKNGSEVDDIAVSYDGSKKSTCKPINYQMECKNKRRSIRRLKSQVSTLKAEIKRLEKV